MIRRNIAAAAALALSGASALSAQATATRQDVAVVGASVSVEPGQIRVPADSAGERRPNVNIQMAAPAFRVGEYYSAPWLDELGGPRGAGRIALSTQIPGIAMRPEERAFYQLNERVYVVPPANRAALNGQRYLSYSLGQSVNGEQVVIPTGVLLVERAGTQNEASVARITHQFSMMQPTDKLMPLDSVAARADSASPVSGGVESRVVWVREDAVLPTMQAHVILDAGSGEGVRLGDVFALVRPRYQMTDGTWLPEKEVARASVVKVTPQGSTLLIVRQTEPAVGIGIAARLIARIR